MKPKRKDKKLFYVLHLSNKITGNLVRVLTYTNQKQAVKDRDFYNSTLNLKATLDTIME